MGYVHEIAENRIHCDMKYAASTLSVDRAHTEFEVSKAFLETESRKIMLLKLKLKARIKPIEIYGIDRPRIYTYVYT